MIGARGREREKKEEGNWDGIGSSGKMKLWKWNINEEGRKGGEKEKERRERFFQWNFPRLIHFDFRYYAFFSLLLNLFRWSLFFFFFILCDNIFESNWIFLARTNVCFVFEILRGMDRCRDGFETDRFVKIRKQNVDRCRCDSTSGPVWYRN